MAEDDDAARREASGTTERATYPGIPTRHLPPRASKLLQTDVTPPEPVVFRQRPRPPEPIPELLSATENEPTPPSGRLELPAHRARSGKTLVGVAPPANGPLKPPVAPPRSLSPVPVSAPTRSIAPESEVEVRVKKKHLQKVWMWVGPVVITAATSSFGYVKGYAKGLLDGHDEIVRMRAEQNRQHDDLVKLKTQVDAVEAGEAAESQSNRSERATRDRFAHDIAEELADVKKRLPTIHGLPQK